MQKSRQIGILKAMGLKDGTASRVFLFEGLLLGIIGGILGIGLGVGLIAMFTKFAVNADGTPVVDVFINWNFIAFSGGIAVVASTISSLIPARKSSKLSPIEVIRNA
jgi:lipoprotein-releasing system permease protein